VATSTLVALALAALVAVAVVIGQRRLWRLREEESAQVKASAELPATDLPDASMDAVSASVRTPNVRAPRFPTAILVVVAISAGAAGLALGFLWGKSAITVGDCVNAAGRAWQGH